jgi:hypothetical protein
MAIDPSGQIGDERPTKLFSESDVATTHRLDPRPTRPERELLNLPLPPSSEGHKSNGNRILLIGIALFLLIAGIVSTLAFVRHRSSSQVATADEVSYPGAKRVMELVSEGGGRAVQLETGDSLAEVRDWYQRVLKPEKVVQLTSGSIIMKNEKTTATIVTEGDKTNILLKIVP